MMGLCCLWFPILLSSVAVFLVSSLIHWLRHGTRATCEGAG
jgi:hypothetical protein